MKPITEQHVRDAVDRINADRKEYNDILDPSDFKVSINKVKGLLKLDNFDNQLDLDSIVVADESDRGVLYHIFFNPSSPIEMDFCRDIISSLGGFQARYMLMCKLHIDRNKNARVRLQFTQKKTWGEDESSSL
jgi:hypothetical protein